MEMDNVVWKDEKNVSPLPHLVGGRPLWITRNWQIMLAILLVVSQRAVQHHLDRSLRATGASEDEMMPYALWCFGSGLAAFGIALLLVLHWRKQRMAREPLQSATTK